MSERHVSTLHLSIGAVIVSFTIAASVPLSAQPPQVSPPSVPAPVPLRDRDWDTISADVTVRQWQQLTTGEEQPSTLPTSRYHFERSMASGQWKTVLTIVDRPEVRIATPTGDVARVDTSQVVRIENDEDGTPLRYFNQRGERIALRAATPAATATSPVTGALPAVSGPSTARHDIADTLRRMVTQQTMPQARSLAPATRDWIDAFVASRADRARRKRALESKYGPVVGQIRGLDRAVRVKDTNVDEVLMHPDMGVPIEVNTMRNGQLVARRTFSYEQNSDGDLIRHAMRVESVLPNDASRRSIVEIEIDHLTFERRR